MTDNNQGEAVERIIKHNTTDNKKLIEEAAKAIQALDFPDHGIGWDESTEYGREYYRESARAALAVFEKALTPTDDERFVKSFSGWDADEVARYPHAAAEAIHKLRERLLAGGVRD